MAGNSVTVAEAFVSIRPDFQGFSSEIESRLKAAGDKSAQTFGSTFSSGAGKAGTKAGDEAGKGFENALKPHATSASTIMRGILGAQALEGAARSWSSSIGGLTNAASDLAEAGNAVNVVFGQGSAELLAFAKNSAEAVGLSAREFEELSTPLGAFLKNNGIAQDQLADQTVNLTKRAADMASVFNTSVPDALNSITSALRGESDPIEKYGVSLSEAAVSAEAMTETGKKSAAQLTQQEKVQARLNLIMGQTAGLQGDCANTSDGLANKTRILNAEMEDWRAKMGANLVPILSTSLGLLQKMPEPVQTAAFAFLQFAPALSQSAIAIGALTPALSAAGPVIQAMGLALLTPPVGIVIALAAAGIAIYLFRDQIKEGLGDALESVQAFADKAGPAITDGLGEAQDFVEGHWREIGTVIAAPFALPAALALDGFGIRSHLIHAMGEAKDGAVKQLSGLASAVKSVPGDVKDALGDVDNLLYDAGKRIVKGFAAGLLSLPGTVFAAAVHLGEEAYDGVKKGAGKLWPGSPSQAGIDVGVAFGQGIAVGMEQGTPIALEAAGKLGTNVQTLIIGGVTSGIENEAPSFLAVLTNLGAEVETFGNKVDTAASGPVASFTTAMDGLTTSLAAAADQHNLDAINAVAGPEAAAAFGTAQSALATLGDEYTTLGGKIDEAEASMATLGDQITAQQTLVDGLKEKLDAAKDSFSNFAHADIAEAAPFDAQAKALKRQQEAVQLQINQLKLKGPLTKTENVIDPKTGKKTGTKTVDTDIGRQVKGLEAQLDQLRLQAQNVDLTKDLQIGPLQDQIDALTDSSKAIPFADIIKGLTDSKAQVDALTPQYETQVGVLGNLKDQYDEQSTALATLKQSYQDIGDQMKTLEGSITSLVTTATTQFDQMQTAAQTAGDSAGPDLATSVASSFTGMEVTVGPAVSTFASNVVTLFGNAIKGGQGTATTETDNFLGAVKGRFDVSDLPIASGNLTTRTTNAVLQKIAENAPGTYTSWDTILGNIRGQFDKDPMPTNAGNLVQATVNSTIGKINENLQTFKDAGKSLTESLATGVHDGGVDAQNNLDTIITNLKTTATNAVSGIATAVGNIGTTFGNALKPTHRAGGGDVRPGHLYMVGEQGPELAIFQQPGQILPNETVRKVGSMPYRHPAGAPEGPRAGDHYQAAQPHRRGQQIASQALKVEFTGPLVINNNGGQKTAKQAADDFLFHLAAGFRRAGWPVSA